MTTLVLVLMLGCSTSTPEPAEPSPAPEPTEAAAPEGTQEAGRYRDMPVTDFASVDEEAPVLIDVRTPEEFAGGHLPGARNMPLGEWDASSVDLPSDQEIYVVCQSGGRSARAAKMLSEAGYDTTNLDGGTGGWIAAGNEVE